MAGLGRYPPAGTALHWSSHGFQRARVVRPRRHGVRALAGCAAASTVCHALLRDSCGPSFDVAPLRSRAAALTDLLGQPTAVSGAVALLVVACLCIAFWRRGSRSPTQGTVLIFGVGFSGERLAQRLLGQAGRWRVLGTSRAAASRERLARARSGLRLFPSATNAFAAARAEGFDITHVVVTAAPGEDGDPLLAELNKTMKGASDALASVRWVGYLSTVGVYGDAGGERVDETRPVAPKSKRGRLRVEAEQAWEKAVGPERLWIFRLPGIYGPGRGPLAKARSGEAKRILAPGHLFSRIHVEDIAGAVSKAMLVDRAHDGPFSSSAGTGPAVLNVVDDEPAPGHQVSGFAFELLGKEPPPCTELEKADLNPVARSFYEESRYVLNQKLRQDLGYQLSYPTYREGLKAQLREEQASRRSSRPSWPVALLRGALRRLGRAALCARSTGRTSRVLVVLDNGSLRAESTLGLRVVADAVRARLGLKAPGDVIAASARFSDRVDPGELGGDRAWTILELLRELRQRRVDEVVVLPNFFGPSGMLTDFLPKQLASLRSEAGPPAPAVKIAPTLMCHCPFLFPGSTPDDRIARILHERILEVAKRESVEEAPAIAIIDHGSPSRFVAQCRHQVVEQVTKLLAAESSQSPVLRPRALVGCCMERRPGPEYAFNGALLEELLESNPDFQQGDVIVALMFLQKGKHAGPGGDIAQIIKKGTAGRQGVRVLTTEVIGNHPLLIDILEERASQALQPAGW